jgi:predicted lipid-binding transport protein (Tim44 family)
MEMAFKGSIKRLTWRRQNGYYPNVSNIFKKEDAMLKKRGASIGLVIFTVFFLLSVVSIEAWARAGGGRSMGSRGSRSYSAPPSTPAPAPANPSQGSRQYGAPAAPSPSPFGGGGFLRGMAGGIVGGMIGGMLFRSLGFAGGGAGSTGGGIGMMDILLIGALLYGIYWFIKRRRNAAQADAGAGTYYKGSPSSDIGSVAPSAPAYESGGQENDVETGLRHIRQMDSSFDEKRFTDGCLDQFFQIQGAWANRDMSGVKRILTEEMFDTLHEDAEQLKAKKRINHLDNIAVRSIEIVELWQEKGADFITVKLYANLLDYTVDELTGQVVTGSKTDPIKFNEYWTFTRPVGDNPWKLSAINQV